MKTMTTRTGLLVTAAAGGLLLAGCGSPAPAVPAVDLGQTGSSSVVPGVTGGPAPVQTSDPAGPDGEYRVVAGGAATVDFSVAGGGIAVDGITLNPGWQQVEDDRSPREVDLTFVQGSTVVSLDAELDDGRFDTDVDIDSPATPGQYTYEVGEAGSVTIEVVGDRVGLVGQETAPGWVATVDERELAGGEVEIRFRADGAATSVDFDADVDDRELNIDIDTRTGQGYAAPPVR